jgi:hypothetical protein
MVKTVVIDVKKTYRIEVSDDEDPNLIASTRIEAERELIEGCCSLDCSWFCVETSIVDEIAEEE